VLGELPQPPALHFHLPPSSSAPPPGLLADLPAPPIPLGGRRTEDASRSPGGEGKWGWWVAGSELAGGDAAVRRRRQRAPGSRFAIAFRSRRVAGRSGLRVSASCRAATSRPPAGRNSGSRSRAPPHPCARQRAGAVKSKSPPPRPAAAAAPASHH
jgi:hypothetical protein